MNPDDAARNMAMLRFGVGAGAWLAPRLSGKAFLLSPDDNPQSPYLGRLFGARDVALAYGSMSSSGAARRTWLVAGLAVDAADAVAAIAGGRAGYLSRLQTALLTAPALAGVAMGLVALRGADGAGPQV
jgi:hypothetical protein